MVVAANVILYQLAGEMDGMPARSQISDLEHRLVSILLDAGIATIDDRNYLQIKPPPGGWESIPKPKLTVRE